jgi:hypothetical protein
MPCKSASPCSILTAQTRAIVPFGAVDPQSHDAIAIPMLTTQFFIFRLPLFVQDIINLSYSGQRPTRYPRRQKEHLESPFMAVAQVTIRDVRNLVFRYRFRIPFSS